MTAASVSAIKFNAQVKQYRGGLSEAGDKLSHQELKNLFESAANVPDLKYAIGQIGLTAKDLKQVSKEMYADGKLSKPELMMLFEAAISPKNFGEAGYSVSKKEVKFFNKLAGKSMSQGATSLFANQVSPRLNAQLDGPARSAGVSVRGGISSSADSIMPRGKRNTAKIVAMMKSEWLASNDDFGFGSSGARIAPSNFSFKTPDSVWGEDYPWEDDDVSREGDWTKGDIGIAYLDKVPKDGILDFTMLAHPSGHNDEDGKKSFEDNGRLGWNTNSWGFSRDNVYMLRVIMPDGTQHTMKNIRNSALGDAQLREFKAMGMEEYISAQDVTLDVSKLNAGDKIRIEMWPGPSFKGDAPSTSSRNYSTDRIFEMVMPADWVPVK